MQTHQIEQLQWLNTVLADQNRRNALRALLAQYELPVIQFESFDRRQIRRDRTASRNLNHFKRARP